jgi:hypothetical protein
MADMTSPILKSGSVRIYPDLVASGEMVSVVRKAVGQEERYMTEVGMPAVVPLTAEQASKNTKIQSLKKPSPISPESPWYQRFGAKIQHALYNLSAKRLGSLAQPGKNFLNLRNWLFKQKFGSSLEEVREPLEQEICKLNTEQGILNCVTDALDRKNKDYQKRATALEKSGKELDAKIEVRGKWGGALGSLSPVAAMATSFLQYFKDDSLASRIVQSPVMGFLVSAIAFVTIVLQEGEKSLAVKKKIDETENARMFGDLYHLIDREISHMPEDLAGRRSAIRRIIHTIETQETVKYKHRNHGVESVPARKKAQVPFVAAASSALAAQEVNSLAFTSPEEALLEGFGKMAGFDVKARRLRGQLIQASTSFSQWGKRIALVMAVIPSVAGLLPDLGGLATGIANILPTAAVSVLMAFRRASPVSASLAAGPARMAAEMIKHRLLLFMTDAIDPKELIEDTLQARVTWFKKEISAIEAEYESVVREQAAA